LTFANCKSPNVAGHGEWGPSEARAIERLEIAERVAMIGRTKRRLSKAELPPQLGRWRLLLEIIAISIVVFLTISPLTSVAIAQSSVAQSGQSDPAGTTLATPNAAPLPAISKEIISAEPQANGQSIGGALLPHDLSPLGMFLHADIVVKAVIIGLAFASLVTWTAFVAKSLELQGARRRARRALRIVSGATTLSQVAQQLGKASGAAGQLVQVAIAEMRLSANMPGEGVKERIALQLERLELRYSRKISLGTGVLATIGATAPFVGLFGTVWGIMNSFIGISNAHTTNLAVVAPGIAEALLATALGLVAAIPAVVVYNVLVRSTAHYRALLGDVSAQVMKLVSRDIDRGGVRLGMAAE
jgi:biopolymer transport protein ExbB